MVLLAALVITLPALRNQMNCSGRNPRTRGKWEFKRGSMQVKAINGKNEDEAASSKHGPVSMISPDDVPR
jgi:hypothetical protein